MLIGKLVDELLDCYRDLRRYLTRELRNPEDAADIAQSSFLRVYSHALDSPTQVQSPRAWMFRTAKHLCIDRARHQQLVDAWAGERVALLADAIAPSAETIVHQRQLAARVLAVLEALAPRRRDVFVLSRVYGYSREEIAGELRITEAAVAKHVVRASVDCAQALARLAADMHVDTASVGLASDTYSDGPASGGPIPGSPGSSSPTSANQNPNRHTALHSVARARHAG